MGMRKSKDSNLEKMGSKHVIIKDVKPEYYGKYIAMSNFFNGEAVAYNKKPLRAIKEAEKKGYHNPIIVYCPEPNVTQIF